MVGDNDVGQKSGQICIILTVYSRQNTIFFLEYYVTQNATHLFRVHYNTISE